MLTPTKGIWKRGWSGGVRLIREVHTATYSGISNLIKLTLPGRFSLSIKPGEWEIVKYIDDYKWTYYRSGASWLGYVQP